MTQAIALRSARLWRDYPREVIAAGVLALLALLMMANAAWSSPTVQSLRFGDTASEVAPPAPPPLLVRQLAPQEALQINQDIPLESGPNPAAKPFTLGSVDAATRTRALDCLTSAVYYEAGSQDVDGQRAVAQVVLNRVRHPAFPSSVCKVVYQGSTRATGCQFTFTCDGSLARGASSDGWARARKVAEAALDGYVFRPVGYATHYHANYVVPYWASSLAKSAVVGAHIFYRWEGGWGRPSAFTQRYSKQEPDSGALRVAALAAEAKNAELNPVDALPGAEELTTVEGKDGKRVAIRFNLAARQAVEDAVAKDSKPYVEKIAASDNLRWSLTGSMVKADEKPFGRPQVLPAPKASAVATPTGGSAAVSGVAAVAAPARAAGGAVNP